VKRADLKAESQQETEETGTAEADEAGESEE